MHDLSRRVEVLFESAGYAVDRPHTLPSGRVADLFADGDQPVVAECETSGDYGTIDSAAGQLPQYADEADAVPMLVLADDVRLEPWQRGGIDSAVHVFTETELRTRFTTPDSGTDEL